MTLEEFFKKYGSATPGLLLDKAAERLAAFSTRPMDGDHQLSRTLSTMGRELTTALESVPQPCPECERIYTQGHAAGCGYDDKDPASAPETKPAPCAVCGGRGPHEPSPGAHEYTPAEVK